MPTTTAWAGWVGRLTVVAARGLAVWRWWRSVLVSASLSLLTALTWTGWAVLVVVLADVVLEV